MKRKAENVFNRNRKKQIEFDSKPSKLGKIWWDNQLQDSNPIYIPKKKY